MRNQEHHKIWTYELRDEDDNVVIGANSKAIVIDWAARHGYWFDKETGLWHLGLSTGDYYLCRNAAIARLAGPQVHPSRRA